MDLQGGDFPFAALLTASTVPLLNLTLNDVSHPTVTPPLEASPNKSSPAPQTSSPTLLSPTRALRPTRITEDSREELEEEGDVDSSDDSFVKVDAGPLFVRQSDLGADLSLLVREWKTAPTQLPSFAAPMHSPRPGDSVTAQLPAFQGLQQSFDQFVQSFQEAEDE